MNRWLPLRYKPRRRGHTRSSGTDAPNVRQSWQIGIFSGAISSIIVLIVTTLVAGYVATIGENRGGFALRDLAPQVQFVGDSWFGAIPGTQSGVPLETSELRLIHRVLGYPSCKNDHVDDSRYVFQAFACLDVAKPGLEGPHEQVLFFYDGKFLGADSSMRDFQVQILDRDSATITVEYSIFHWNTTNTQYANTFGTEIVPFALSVDRQVVAAQAAIPPVASHIRDGR